jgi:hypothetical protein
MDGQKEGRDDAKDCHLKLETIYYKFCCAVVNLQEDVHLNKTEI